MRAKKTVWGRRLAALAAVGATMVILSPASANAASSSSLGTTTVAPAGFVGAGHVFAKPDDAIWT